MKLDSILVAVDWSDATAAAVDMADGLAQRYDCRVHLLHCVCPDNALVVSDGSMPDLIKPYLFETPEEAKKHLDELKAGMKHDAENILCHAVQGAPATTILHQQQLLGTDLIIMGSHGHGALYHLLVGSVAEGVMHKAPCPVMLVPSPGKAEG